MDPLIKSNVILLCSYFISLPIVSWHVGDLQLNQLLVAKAVVIQPDLALSAGACEWFPGGSPSAGADRAYARQAHAEIRR